MPKKKTKKRTTKKEYGGFWIRFVAHLVDTVVIYIIGFIIGLGIGFILAITGYLNATIAISTVTGFLVSWLYSAGLESSDKQATLGKQLLKLKVTDLKGKRISFSKATIRYLAKILSGLVLLIGYIMIAFTEKKQGLHDIIAKTLVVKTK
jgi:uncharacterized RDD family membrane protein YckC